MAENQKRICVITPYYKEDRALLERCMDSVRRQTVPAEHFLVADGFPQDWIDGAGVRHLRFDRAHGDYGNVARGIGAQMAAAEKYDAIAFLDADNWYDDDHVERCLAAAAGHPGRVDYVVARRKFVRPDGSEMPTYPAEIPDAEHIDTNAHFFLPPSYHLIHRWCSIPQELSAFGDHLFYFICKNEGLVYAVTDKRTINYTCLFENVYRNVGEEPPAGCKPPVNWAPVQAWLDTLSAEQFLVVQRMSGLYLKRE